MINYSYLINILEKYITRNILNPPLVVGIDGPDCSGKTTLSTDLLKRLKKNYKTLIIHCDDYINELALDFDVNSCTHESFYNDFFDVEAIAEIIKTFHDQKTYNNPIFDIILFEGLFLARIEFEKYIDSFIRIEIKNSLILDRALIRDVGKLGSKEWVMKHYTNQCIPAQDYYRQKNNPTKRSNFIIEVIESNKYEIRKGSILSTR